MNSRESRGEAMAPGSGEDQLAKCLFFGVFAAPNAQRRIDIVPALAVVGAGEVRHIEVFRQIMR